MKPAKGQAWDSFEHRAADALVQLCEQPDTTDETPMVASRPVVQVHVPPHGPAEIAGIPIADSLLEQLRANATIEPVLVDDDGAPVAVGRRSPGLSPKIARAVLLRDGGRCRCCDRKGQPRPPPSTTVVGWDRRPVEPGHGGEHVPSRSHPPWQLRPGRQCQRARGSAQDPPRRPHARTTRTGRPPTTQSRTGAVIRGWRAGSPASRCRAGSRAARPRTGTPSGRRPRRRPRALRSRRCRGWACPCTG